MGTKLIFISSLIFLSSSFSTAFELERSTGSMTTNEGTSTQYTITEHPDPSEGQKVVIVKFVDRELNLSQFNFDVEVIDLYDESLDLSKVMYSFNYEKSILTTDICNTYFYDGFVKKDSIHSWGHYYTLTYRPRGSSAIGGPVCSFFNGEVERKFSVPVFEGPRLSNMSHSNDHQVFYVPKDVSVKVQTWLLHSEK